MRTQSIEQCDVVVVVVRRSGAVKPFFDAMKNLGMGDYNILLLNESGLLIAAESTRTPPTQHTLAAPSQQARAAPLEAEGSRATFPAVVALAGRNTFSHLCSHRKP
jgi:hypothetical protein